MSLSLQRDSAGHCHSVSRVKHVIAMANCMVGAPYSLVCSQPPQQLQRTRLTPINS